MLRCVHISFHLQGNPYEIDYTFIPLLQDRDHGDVSQALASTAKFKSVPKKLSNQQLKFLNIFNSFK